MRCIETPYELYLPLRSLEVLSLIIAMCAEHVSNLQIISLHSPVCFLLGCTCSGVNLPQIQCSMPNKYLCVPKHTGKSHRRYNLGCRLNDSPCLTIVLRGISTCLISNGPNVRVNVQAKGTELSNRIVILVSNCTVTSIQQ